MRKCSIMHFGSEGVLGSSCREVPKISLRVPSRILSLAVRLVQGRRIYSGSGTLGMMIVNVYVVDEDNETAWLCREGPGRDQTVFGVDAVDPDYRVASVYLGVEWPTTGISNQSALFESEDVHEEPLGGLHVFVHSQRNDGLGYHARTSLPICKLKDIARLFHDYSSPRVSRRTSEVT